MDDLLPLDIDGRLLASASNVRSEIWVSLLEKAYMKVKVPPASVEPHVVSQSTPPKKPPFIPRSFVFPPPNIVVAPPHLPLPCRLALGEQGAYRSGSIGSTDMQILFGWVPESIGLFSENPNLGTCARAHLSVCCGA